MEQLAQQLVNGLAWGSIYALIALGYTMVYGVLRLINFAHGDVYMVGAMCAFYFAHWLGFAAAPSLPGFVIVMLLAMLACALLGALIERVAYRPLRRQPRAAMLTTAIGVSMLLEYGGQLVFGPDPKFFPQLIESQSVRGGRRRGDQHRSARHRHVAGVDVRPALAGHAHARRHGAARGELQLRHRRR